MHMLKYIMAEQGPSWLKKLGSSFMRLGRSLTRFTNLSCEKLWDNDEILTQFTALPLDLNCFKIMNNDSQLTEY